MPSIQAFILCGGLGTRLRLLVGDKPKPMAPIAGRPFLEYLLLQLRHQGFQNIVLCTGYQSRCIEEYFGSGELWKLRLKYSREEQPLGTAGALKHAEPLMHTEQLLVLNGDSFFDIALAELLQYHEQKQAVVTVALVYAEDAQRFGFVTMNTEGKIVRFSEKTVQSSGWINGGIYIIQRDLIERIPTGRAVSLEHEIFPNLVGHDFYGLQFRAPLWDIGTTEAYLKLQSSPDYLVSAVCKKLCAMSDFNDLVRRRIEMNIALHQALLQGVHGISEVAHVLITAYQAGKKALFFGNGGSAADAQHLAGELVGKYYLDRRPLAAEALTVNTSSLTAIANDYSFDRVFARQIEAIGNLGDVAVGISTSGNSPNVIEGVRAAKRKGMITVGLTGANGGHLKREVDYCICAPSQDTPRIQEAHILIGHIWCELIERALFGHESEED